MLALGAIFLATAAATSTILPTPTLPWWEKVTVTLAGEGEQQSCRYQSSLGPAQGQSCEARARGMKSSRTQLDGTYTKITFERRFTPDRPPEQANVEAGEKLLAGQVMAITIDSEGAVRGCRVVASSGDMLPDYGCDDARAERFQASGGGSSAGGRVGYFTILVYGHTAQLV